MLNQMPIDILKLDMKFIQTETAKSLDHGILRFIMDLARWMHLSVVAEGVETREQVVRLAEIGCDYVQGYYFSKPISCEAFEELLKTRQITEKEEWKRRGSGEQHQILIADEDAAYRVGPPCPHGAVPSPRNRQSRRYAPYGRLSRQPAGGNHYKRDFAGIPGI